MRVTNAGDKIAYSRLEQRWFATLLLYTAAPIVAVVVYRIPRGIDFWWDTLMAVGVMAGAGLALLPLLSARWWVRQHRETPFLRLIQAVHRHVSYVALALVAVHIAGLLVLEERVIEYLKLSASAPMLAGLVASVLFLGLILTSKFREQLAWTYRSWRYWHAVLSSLAVGLLLFKRGQAGSAYLAGRASNPVEFTFSVSGATSNKHRVDRGCQYARRHRRAKSALGRGHRPHLVGGVDVVRQPASDRALAHPG